MTICSFNISSQFIVASRESNEKRTSKPCGAIDHLCLELRPSISKEKFITASEDSFDYSALLLPAALAGYSMATKATPEFHQGAAGYGRYFWHSYADQSIEN
jgi:hypothetical protein